MSELILNGEETCGVGRLVAVGNSLFNDYEGSLRQYRLAKIYLKITVMLIGLNVLNHLSCMLLL